MNRKKLLYIAAIIVVLGLGYINYFGDEKTVAPKAQVIETTDVTYNSDGYEIEALKQKDMLKSDETTFEKAQAKVKNLFLSGDNILLDKAKNLILKNNIFGKSINGWEFKTEAAKYIKEDDLIVSDSGVTAINKEKGMEISGKNFKSDSKMDFMNLQGDVSLKVKDYTLLAEKAEYNNKSKIVNIFGNIKLESNNSKVAKGKLFGEFKKGRYNIETKILEAWEPFEIDYNGTKLYGEHLIYNEETGAFKITKNVHVVSNGYNIKMDSITRENEKALININGPVEGDNKVNFFKGNRGYYNEETGLFELVGDIKGHSNKGDKLLAEKLFYFKDNETFKLYGKDGEDVYYKNATKEIKAPEVIYNEKTGIGEVIKGYVFDEKDNQYASGDLVTFNDNSKKYIVKGNGYFKDKDYIFKSDLIEYEKEKDLALLPGKYTVTERKSNGVFKGSNGKYILSKGDFESKGDFTYENKEEKLSGENLKYNIKSGYGTIEKNVVLLKKEDNTIVKGNSGEFKNNNYAKIIGNLEILNSNADIYGNSGTYFLNENKVIIPGKINFKGKEKDISGTMENGVYYVNSGKMIGKNFHGKNMNNIIKSDIINYYVNKNEVVLEKNCVIKNLEGTLKSSLINYELDNNEVILKNKFVMDYRDFKVTSSKGTINMNSNSFITGPVNILSKLGDKFSADSSKGNMKNMVIDLNGNTHGEFMDKGVLTKFKGDNTRVYLKDENNTYVAQRIEVIKNGEIIREDLDLKSDYLEMDVPRNLVFAKDNSVVVMKNERGTTTIKSKSMNGDLNTEIINLNIDVHIINKNKEGEVTNLTSTKATIKNKENIVELMGDVIAENAKATISADSAIYNTKTNKIKAKGNVFIDYKSKTSKSRSIINGESKDAYKNFMKQ